MKKCPCGRLAVIGLLLLGASACSTIKSWFPDKERDYQFTTEIPELIVPEDLKTKTFPTRSETVAANAEPIAQTTATTKVAEVVEPVASKPEAEPLETAASPGRSVQTTGASGVSSLQIDQSVKQAWWLVGKALSRQKLEVVERNMDKGYFFVKYDPEAIKPEDGSIWDEVTFLFGDDPSQEQEYRVSLQELDAQLTEVTVQNSEGQTISNAAATALLRLITEGINQDLPTSTNDNPGSGSDQSTAP